MTALNTRFILISFFLSMIFSLSAKAQIQVAGSSIIAGTGCSDSTAAIVLAPDNSSFTLLFSDMNTGFPDAAPPQNGEIQNSVKTAPLKTCGAVINFRIPANMQLELDHIDYRGFMSLPNPQTYGRVESKVFFKGGTIIMPWGRQASERLPSGPQYIQRGPFQNNFTWSAQLSGGNGIGRHISACGGQATLQVNATVGGHSFDLAQAIDVQLDSADGSFQHPDSSGIKYSLALKPCDKWNKQMANICKQGTCPFAR